MDNMDDFLSVFNPHSGFIGVIGKSSPESCAKFSEWATRFYGVTVRFEINENGNSEYFVDSEEDLVKLKLML